MGKAFSILCTRFGLVLLFIAGHCPSALAAPAFPEAEGFGAMATGGRGNPVVHVTNLADSGPGSLRDALARGDRIVVFDVSGEIELSSKLVAGGDNLTIAGQTAPGDGITIYGDGATFSGRKNIVVRFLRFHQGLARGSTEGTKAVNLTDVQDAIFDHVSVQWGRWDGFGITGNSARVTVQDSIIGEGIVPQKFGALIDSADQITIARTLWIDNESRNPKFKANGQYINNVVYNWGSGGGLVGGHSGANWYEDVINNYFIAGPSDGGSFLSQYASTDHVFHEGNRVDLDRDGELAGRAVVDGDFKGDTPPTFEGSAHNHPSVTVPILTPQEAFDHVVAVAGVCSKRDSVDERLLSQLRSLGASGAILRGDDGEAAVGGQPAVTESQRAAGFDSDNDGMPDTWEAAHGLDPTSADDATASAGADGYTNVEAYLNETATNACNGAPNEPDAGTDEPADAGPDGAPTNDGGNPDAGDPQSEDAGSPPDAGVGGQGPDVDSVTTSTGVTPNDTTSSNATTSPDPTNDPASGSGAGLDAGVSGSPQDTGSGNASSGTSGCGCHLASTRSKGLGWLLLALALPAWWRRRSGMERRNRA